MSRSFSRQARLPWPAISAAALFDSDLRDLARPAHLPAGPAWRRTQCQLDLPRLTIAPGIEVDCGAGCHRRDDCGKIA